jgi:hypothetical protein
MSMQTLSFDLSGASRRLVLFFFPALFTIALLFPPLLLLIPAAALPILLFVPEVLPLFLARVLVSTIRLPGWRSPPLAD